MELNQTTQEETPIVMEIPEIPTIKQVRVKKVKPQKTIPKDFSEIREMNQKELQDTCKRLQKIISEVGNQACELEDKHLFDTCVIILKMMNLYSEHSQK